MANTSYNVAFPLPDGSVNVTNIAATEANIDPENGLLYLRKNNTNVAVFTKWLYILKQ